MRVGLFDSGIGGLTVLNRLVNLYPKNDYIYFGDIKNNPYGNKTKEELEILSTKIIDFLLTKDLDLIIIACGTVSSNIYNILKQKYNIEILDIISPVINYINSSSYDDIGVIATNATVNSNIFNSIKRNIKQIACPMFVPMIEKNNYNEFNYYLNHYLYNLKDRKLIILGCTHFPIIKNEINEYFNNNIKLLDMSECLPKLPNKGEGNIELYFSKLDDTIINNIKNIVSFENYLIKEKNDC